MTDFNYSDGMVHGKLGSFVKKWGKKLAAEKAATASARVAIQEAN